LRALGLPNGAFDGTPVRSSHATKSKNPVSDWNATRVALGSPEMVNDMRTYVLARGERVPSTEEGAKILDSALKNRLSEPEQAR